MIGPRTKPKVHVGSMPGKDKRPIVEEKLS
jgi:hypothetical protein